MSIESPNLHTDLLAPVTDDECCGGANRADGECCDEGKGGGMGHGEGKGHGRGMGRGQGECCGGQGRGNCDNADVEADAEKVTQPEVVA
jgi:hypothetical protein